MQVGALVLGVVMVGVKQLPHLLLQTLCVYGHMITLVKIFLLTCVMAVYTIGIRQVVLAQEL